MKDYILKKVALKLCKLGINSQLEDYPMESIDMRAFILNKEFNFITKEFDSINNDLYTKSIGKYANHTRIPSISSNTISCQTKNK